ncbi:MAG: hypothetical protein B7733_17445 [Myxococcales bacterium FL481]|nr:MAG: hypothetical protein B7733_17445 [Myxococcales bacterium FL481]
MIYLVGMQNGGTSIGSNAPPTVEALDRWVDELDFEATHLLLDPDWEVIERYWDANPGGTYSQAVTAIVDRGMKIRRIGDTYDTNHELNLSILEEILSE